MKTIPFEELIESQKAAFAADPDGWLPHFFVHTPDRILMIPAATADEDEKDNMLICVAMILKYVRAKEYYHFGDVWTVEQKADDPLPQSSLANSPNRTEALAIMRVKAGGDIRMRLCPYDRTSRGIVWRATTDAHHEQIGGRYAELMNVPDAIITEAPPMVIRPLEALVEKFTINKQG